VWQMRLAGVIFWAGRGEEIFIAAVAVDLGAGQAGDASQSVDEVVRRMRRRPLGDLGIGVFGDFPTCGAAHADDGEARSEVFGCDLDGAAGVGGLGAGGGQGNEEEQGGEQTEWESDEAHWCLSNTVVDVCAMTGMAHRLFWTRSVNRVML
jgi:hypothetical protein